MEAMGRTPVGMGVVCAKLQILRSLGELCGFLIFVGLVDNPSEATKKG